MTTIAGCTTDSSVSSRFRWVALQLDRLRLCLSRHDVEEQLLDLPKGLYESYDQLINQIDERRHGDARKLLQWLAFSVRPLYLDELAEVVAVDFDSRDLPWFDCNRRYYDARDVIRVCSGFISIAEGIYVAWLFKKRRLTNGCVRQSETLSFLCEGIPSLKPPSSINTIISHHGNDLPLTHIQNVPGISCAIR